MLLQDLTAQINLHNVKLENDFNTKICMTIKQNLNTPVNTVCASANMVHEEIKNLNINPEKYEQIRSKFNVMNSSLNVMRMLTVY